MVEPHQGTPMSGISDATNANTAIGVAFGQPERQPQLEAMDENAVGGSTLKRKSFAMSDSPPAPSPPTQGERCKAVMLAPSPAGATAGGGGEQVFRQTNPRNRSEQSREQQQDISIQVSSVNVGETLRVPLSGKTVPFRVVKRRGRGFSSVVFECEREKEEDGGPSSVTVKVRFSTVVRGMEHGGGRATDFAQEM